MDLVKDLQKNWIPDHPRYAKAKKNALTYFRKAAGLAADSGQHAVLLGYLEREGFAKLVQELSARIQCRGEVRRQIDLNLDLFRVRGAQAVSMRCIQVGCTEGALVSSFAFSADHGHTDLDGDFHITHAGGVPLKQRAGLQMSRTPYAVIGRLSMASKPLGEIALRILRRA